MDLNYLKNYPSEHNKQLIEKIKLCFCPVHKQYAEVKDISSDYLNFKVACCCQELEQQVRSVQV